MTTFPHAWRTRWITCGVLIVGAMLAGIATARAETPEQRQACTDDAFQLCSDAMPDRERVFACLVEKRTMISPLCREGMAAFLPPEPAPVQVSRTPPKAKTKKKTKPVTETKAGNKKSGAPLSLAPKTP
jgi:hypothetical protein